MSFADLFRPKWRHSDAGKRKVAVQKTANSRILAEVARNDTDPSVRAAAIRKATDHAVLCDISKSDSDPDVCMSPRKHVITLGHLLSAHLSGNFFLHGLRPT